MNGRGGLRTAAGLATALAVNAALLAGLAWLNQPADVAADRAGPARVTLRRAATQQPVPDAAALEPRQPRTEPTPPSVAVETPSPAPATLEPLELRLELAPPRMSPVRIAVRQPTRQPPQPAPTPPEAAPTPQPATKPSSKPSPEPAPAPQPTGPRRADQVDQPAREKPGNPRPAYPRAAIRRGIEGRVEARLLIDPAGHVQRIEILDVEGHADFADAVREAVRQFRFEPAVHHGRRVPQLATKVFRFRLEGR